MPPAPPFLVRGLSRLDIDVLEDYADRADNAATRGLYPTQHTTNTKGT